MKLWEYFDPNPHPDDEPDCTIRAICAVTGLSWREVFAEIAPIAYWKYGTMESNRIWSEFIYRLGFRPRKSPRGYTVRDFCLDHPRGKFLVCPYQHVAAVIDGKVWDSWNCLDKRIYFWWEKGG